MFVDKLYCVCESRTFIAPNLKSEREPYFTFSRKIICGRK